MGRRKNGQPQGRATRQKVVMDESLATARECPEPGHFPAFHTTVLQLPLSPLDDWEWTSWKLSCNYLLLKLLSCMKEGRIPKWKMRYFEIQKKKQQINWIQLIFHF